MTVTQQAKLSGGDEYILKGCMRQLEEIETTRAAVRDSVVAVLKRSSYREVARVTGLSTNTLQRWVRESK